MGVTLVREVREKVRWFRPDQGGWPGNGHRRGIGIGGIGARTPRALLVASDSPHARTSFEDAVTIHDGFALAGTCAWRDVVDRCARCLPEAVVLDASAARLARLSETVTRLRALEQSPVIMLLVGHGVARADVYQVDAVVTVDRGLVVVLEVLDVLMSGAVLAMAPQPDRVHADVATDYRMRQRLSTLTKRERDILLLIVDGLSNREVGSRLFISPDTVKEYVSRILAKLEVTSRIEAAVAAVRAEFDSGDWWSDGAAPPPG